MTVLSWTVPLRPAETRAGLRLDRDEIMRSMRDKAENPAAYIPYIASCEVHERYHDGILREITYSSGERVVERVTYGSDGRFVFDVRDPIDVDRVVNQVFESGGEFHFVLEVTLSEEGERKAMSDREFLKETSSLFAGSLLTIVEATVRHPSTAV
ncbi:protein of unknown function [Actinopolyspora xinjiangensis]|uniref:DUF1857 domain-containing protein n=1 Tax=Actinopolyspora xinjiangensis TaxID=405564 RepID=A0A1H0W1N7_9ACTN|nr:AtaL-like protein [Actinopolyspora xinjiangensis]SDP84609.1 protein of unknown function [Actinopolyspora xinjiangensis]